MVPSAGKLQRRKLSETASGTGEQDRFLQCSSTSILKIRPQHLSTRHSKNAAAPARAIAPSCSASPPDTPIAPQTSRALFFKGTPPEKVMSPPFEFSTP